MKNLSNFEKLSILTTASQSKKDYWVDVELVAELVAFGDEWALFWQYEWFDKEPHSKDAVVDETVEIFEMITHAKRSADEIGRADLFDKIGFNGFDGNNDEHFHVAKVLVDKLGRFTDVPNATANSHSSMSIARMRAALSEYRPLRKQLLEGCEYKLMDAQQLEKLGR